MMRIIVWNGKNSIRANALRDSELVIASEYIQNIDGNIVKFVSVVQYFHMLKWTFCTIFRVHNSDIITNIIFDID